MGLLFPASVGLPGPRRPDGSRVDGMWPATTLDAMELHLPAELEGKLAAAANRRGVSVEVFAEEALERAIEFDDWPIRVVETGLRQVDAGQTLNRDAVGERLAKKVAEHGASR